MAQLIGLDIGGTKISTASLEGTRMDGPHLSSTRTSGAAALIDQIAESVERIRGPDAAGVGIGVPSVVEFSTGRIKSSVNIPLQDVPLRALLTERLGLPVFVDNDANCAALAEAYEGDRVVVQNLVMLTLGTGVGGGLVLGGRIYRGATGASAEIGHTLIGLDLEKGAPASSDFPQAGSLESLASGRALDALARNAANSFPRSNLGRLAAQGMEILGPDVVRLAREGDAEGQRLIRIVGERLGVGIANAINFLDPDAVVIGGGVAEAGKLLLEPARETARRFILRGVGETTEIRLARHGAHAGVVGATLLVRHEIEAGTVATGTGAP